MKIKVIPVIISALISALLSYSFCLLCKVEDNAIIMAIGSWIGLFLTMSGLIGVSTEYPRTNINLRVVSAIFLVIFLITSIVFALVQFTPPTYIIVNGIILLTWVLITNGIAKSKQ